MENPFELIFQKLEAIEKLLKEKQTCVAPDTETILNMDQAAEFIGISKATLYGYTSSSKVPHYRNGKFICFKRSELQDWITRFRVKTTEEIEQEAATYIATGGLNRRRR